MLKGMLIDIHISCCIAQSRIFNVRVRAHGWNKMQEIKLSSASFLSFHILKHSLLRIFFHLHQLLREMRGDSISFHKLLQSLRILWHREHSLPHLIKVALNVQLPINPLTSQQIENLLRGSTTFNRSLRLCEDSSPSLEVLPISSGLLCRVVGVDRYHWAVGIIDGLLCPFDLIPVQLHPRCNDQLVIAELFPILRGDKVLLRRNRLDFLLCPVNRLIIEPPVLCERSLPLHKIPPDHGEPRLVVVNLTRLKNPNLFRVILLRKMGGDIEPRRAPADDADLSVSEAVPQVEHSHQGDQKMI